MSKFREDILDPLFSSKIVEFLKDDLGHGDITTDAIVDRDIYAEAQIICNEDGVISGIDAAIMTFNLLNCFAKGVVKEGEKIKAGRPVIIVNGRANSILKGERTALNILGRMSGVATETRRMIDKASRANKNIRVAATRKTLPGFGLFDKKAIQSGGGDTHRFCLNDAVLIKDNHLRIAGSITEAVKTVRKKISFTKKIEVEVSSIDEALEAANAGSEIIMLDNFSPQEIYQTVKVLEENELREGVFLEASGGIRLKNIKEYSKTGVDAVSSGHLTHSSASLDFSLHVISKTEAK